MGVAGLFTDLGVVERGGDSVEVPYFNAFTVATSEAATPGSTAPQVNTLTVNQPRFVNQAVTDAQQRLLMGGDGTFAGQVGRRAMGDLMNAIDAYLIEELIKTAALDPANHSNLDLQATIGDDDVADVVASILEQDGVMANSDLRWLGSPRASSQIKPIANYSPFPNPNQPNGGVFGLPQIATLDGYPYAQHAGVPGRGIRLQSAISASVITSNVLTVTVGAAEAAKYVVGQLVYTTGLTTNVAQASPAAITGITAGDITMALTAANAADNGTGTLFSASSFLMLLARDWTFYSDAGAPMPSLTKRTDAAGWSLQLIQHVGAVCHPGAVRVLHLAD